MKKVLVTGIGGSIAVHVIDQFMRNTDWNIVGIDSFRHKGEFNRIAQMCEGHYDWLPRIEILTHDLTAPFSSQQVDKLRGVDYIINLASLSDVQASIDDPVPFIRNNVDITLNTLELARIVKPDVFIQFSTDEVYGPAEKDQGHTEWSTILPSNPYSASKAAQEAIAIAYWRSYDVPVIITNTMNNFDTMQQSNKYPVKIQKSLLYDKIVLVHCASDGQIGTRYYLSSRNTADALRYILKKLPAAKHVPGSVDRPDRYNIVGDKQLSNLELAESIASIMHKGLKYELVDFHSKQPGHDLHYGLDGTKLKGEGWTPPETYEQSMERVITWQNEHKEWIA